MGFSLKPLLDSVTVVNIFFFHLHNDSTRFSVLRKQKHIPSSAHNSEFACGLLWKQEAVLSTGGSVGKFLFPQNHSMYFWIIGDLIIAYF